MLCFAERKRFLADLQTVSAVTPRRHIKPILRMVRASFRDGALALEATDLEVGVRLSTPLSCIGSEAPCLLSPGDVAAVLKNAKAKEFVLAGYPDEVRVKVDGTMTHLPGGDADEFPVVPEFPEAGYWTVDADQLLTQIERTELAANKEHARWAMEGVKFEFHEDKLRLVATDGKRLAVALGDAVDGTDGQHPRLEDGPVIVPSMAINLVSRVMKDRQEVKVCVRRNEIIFAAKGVLVYSRLVEGRFPPWRDVFPSKKSRSFRFCAGLMIDALRKVTVALDEESKRCTLTFLPEVIELDCRCKVKQAGTTVPCSGDEGKPWKVAIDAKYLTDWLRVIPKNGQVTAEIFNSFDKNSKLCDVPAVFGFPGCQYVVMPLT